MTDLTITSGRPAALRDALADGIANHRATDPLTPTTLLVGASLQRPYLARWLAARLGGHANVRILMPGDLALLLGAPTLVESGRRALPPLADRVLLAQVARATPGYFAPVADAPGFAEALYRLVRELRGAGYDLSDLEPLLAGTTDAPEKSSALAELLAAFEARRANFYGPDDALAVADPSRLDGLGLLVYGVLEMSHALERLVLGVAERQPVDVYLPEVAGAEDAPIAALRDRLSNAGAAERSVAAPGGGTKGPGAHRSSEWDRAVTRETTALEKVRHALFTPPAGAIDPDATLKLVSAPDPAREVRAAARACLAWAADGVPFFEIAIAYRHGDAYRPLVESVFAEADIPVYLHEGSPVSERPLGRQTLALLELFDSDLSRRSVMDFLTDARLPKELRDEYEGGIPAARWDSVSREAGIVAGAGQWAARLRVREEELRGEEREDELSEWTKDRIADAQALARFIATLHGDLERRPRRAPWAVHLDYLQQLLARYVVGAQEIVEALRGLERFTALESEVSFEQFLDVVRRAIETLRSEDVLQGSAGAFARRGVNVLAVSSLAGIEFARVWMLGATERAFPPPARQDPILLDDERAAISQRAPQAPGALGGLEARGDRGSEEELGFALACEAARERLVLSYARRATGESRPRLPSVFFRELASQLAGERVSAERAPLLQRADVERIPGDAIGVPIPDGRFAKDADVVSVAAAGAISPSERDRTYLQAEITQPLARATFERAAPSFARALVSARARRSSRYSEWDGALGDAAREAIAALVPAERTYAPTSLQTYAECPQRFLMSDVLRVRKVEEPERTVRIDALRRGSLFHRIFQRFYAEWSDEGSPTLAPDAEQRMRAISEEECDAAQARGETGYPAMWAADRLEVVEDCLQWLEEERKDERAHQLPLAAVEVRVGRPYPGETATALSRDEPVEIGLDARTLRLSGRIDRLSWDAQPPTRFRVVDYKTGRVYEKAELQGGRMLQLPLYVQMGAPLLGLDVSAGEAAYVYPTRTGKFRTVEWSREAIAARHDEMLALLGAMLDAIDRGDFMIAPYDADKACRYCDMNPVCPRPRAAYVERKAGDARIAVIDAQIRSVE
jgi:ATP-dependent helicase/nuclease subunit B